MNNSSSQPSRLLLVLAFAAVYIVWGSTYLAIHVVVDTLPAFTSAAIRFVIAGGLLLMLLAVKGTQLPSPAQWRHSLISGTLMLVGGNGLVVWAEKSISSSLAALLVALAPVWFALLDWLRPGGVRPQLKTVMGIVVGFIGVAILVRPGDNAAGNTVPGSIAVVFAGLCWAGGSLYSKYSPNSGSPWMNAAAQMLCGGAGLAVVGLLLGEPAATPWGQVSAASVISLLYLIVFGSWIGFSAYLWLLRNVSATQVSTYAYVNPVIAVFLGWAFLEETITSSMIAGAMVVLAGVAIISIPGTALATAARGFRMPFARRIAPEPVAPEPNG
jgi:drug/metabolite transporter (DMT)-like permease